MTGGWRRYWRRYLWFCPVQWCMICGKWYWGGFPYPSLHAWRHGWFWEWQPWWVDYCSRKCAEEDSAMRGDDG